MAYCTVADIRDEGITDAQVSDVRLSLLIDEATQTIDRITGWFFEPRQMTLRLDGRGAPTIEPPYPPISISEFLVNDWDFAITDANMVTVGAPVQ
ncbi:MAG: hypothetical protein GY854_14170, partial [Deltaproteobacteria bacterium]|nr:hypothetical protein [Deltaproteobacteria bacterium]